MKTQQPEDQEHLDVLKGKLEAIGPYARQMSTAMVVLAMAVEEVLNFRDAAVIAEMKSVCAEIFEQAEKALEDNSGNLQ